MGVTGGGLIQCEELLQLPKWEMPFYILLFIHHTAAQGLLVGLALEYLLLYGPCLQASQRWSTVGTLVLKELYMWKVSQIKWH